MVADNFIPMFGKTSIGVQYYCAMCLDRVATNSYITETVLGIWTRCNNCDHRVDRDMIQQNIALWVVR